jgi:flagellar basal-body rod modification protein FlgD
VSIIDAQSTLNTINNATSKTRFEQGRERLGSSDIGKDGFLQLLLVQLKHQDPINQVDNTVFLSPAQNEFWKLHY